MDRISIWAVSSDWEEGMIRTEHLVRIEEVLELINEQTYDLSLIHI